MLDPGLADLSGMFGGAADSYQKFLDNQNTATGLSPEALSALRTQGTSGINDQYQSAAQSINSQLLRRGAAGGGELPGSGGDISRAYQPLYSAMEAAKTKAQTDTIMADEAAKEKSLYQNQQLAMQAAGNVFGNANTLYNSGNNAILGAAGIADKAAELEGPSWLKLLGTAGISGLLNPSSSGGGLGGLISGGGTNGSGKFGVLGDLLGGIFGGGNSTHGTDAEALSKVDWGANDNSSALGKVAGLGEAGLADAFKQLPAAGGAVADAAGSAGGFLGDALGTVGAGLGTAASAVGSGIASAAGAVGSGLSSLASAAVPLLTNPITAIAGAAILGAVAWTKSQAHWEANTWTKGFQAPFDNHMQDAVNQVQQLKASGQYTPEVAQQMQSSAKDAIDGYLQKLDTFYREKGTNSDQAKVASQAWATFQKYYGPGGQGYLDQLAA